MIGYVKYKNQFQQLYLDKRILGLLIIGVFSTSIINIPIYLNDKLIIFINFGAIIIPILISAIFLYKFSSKILEIIILILLIGLITYLLAKVDPDHGIIIEFPFYFLPILIGVLFSVLLFRYSIIKDSIALIPIAYCICTLGIFIGTDIFLFPSILDENIRTGYIGGQGIFDLIYIAGLFSIALTLIIFSFQNRYNYSTSKKLTDHMLKSPGHRDRDYKQKNVKKLMTVKIADLKYRAMAFFIDCAIQILLITLLFYLFFKEFFLNYELSILTDGIKWAFLFGWASVIHIFYFTIFEWISGQTPGKEIAQIKVITYWKIKNNKIKIHSKNRIEFSSILTRNILRFLETILGFYLISIFLIQLTSKHQRIGDIFADSIVITLKKSN
jgi:uncharacterized RDD family membrane protein YckC